MSHYLPQKAHFCTTTRRKGNRSGRPWHMTNVTRVPVSNKNLSKCSRSFLHTRTLRGWKRRWKCSYYTSTCIFLHPTLGVCHNDSSHFWLFWPDKYIQRMKLTSATLGDLKGTMKIKCIIIITSLLTCIFLKKVSNANICSTIKNIYFNLLCIQKWTNRVLIYP